MGFNHNGPQGPVGQMPPPGNMAALAEWKELGAQLSAQRFNRNSKGQRRLLATLAIITLILVIFAAVRMNTLASNNGDQLTIHIASQQDAIIDLRKSVEISPYLFGANVLPEVASNSTDADNSGVMPYSPKLAQGLQTMGIKMLRYPGGSWGEQHILSNDQLNDFNKMLTDTKTTGMMQVHLGGTKGQDDPAQLATQWVQSMKSVQLWSIGNEPDLTTNPATGKPYTADEYAQEFIQISTKMHQANPNIKVFGPELSSYFDANAGFKSANAHTWIDEFLQKIGEYEKQNNGKVLDGISFHYYPHTTPFAQPGLLMSSGNEWSYILPDLRAQIQKTLGRDVPIAITAMNTNPDRVGSQAQIPPAYGALWLADTMGTLMNEQIAYAAFYSASPAMQNPASLFAIDGSETSMGRIFELFTHLQDQVVPLAIQDDPLAVFATTSKDHKTLSLMFVNKTPLTQHAQVNPSTIQVSSGSWPFEDIKIAAYSAVVVTLHRDSGKAEGYTFIPPTKTDGLVAPVNSAICGLRTDPVDASIPC
jgi:hypothetical protein